MKYCVFYDGSCPSCTRAAALLSRLDWFHRLELTNLHRAGVLEAAGIERDKALQRIQVQNSRGAVFEGMRALLQISAKLPSLWLLVPFFWFSIKARFGDWLYDWIAARRLLFPTPESCDWQVRQ